MDRPMLPTPARIVWTTLVTGALSLSCAGADATDLNLLPHGDFETADDLNAWVVLISPAPVGSIFWSTDDADANLSSGSIELATAGDVVASSCFRVKPGATYSFSGMSKSVNAYSTSISTFDCLTFFDESCTVSGGPLGVTEFPLDVGTATAWSATPMVAGTSGTLPTLAKSARCYVLLSDPTPNTIDVRFDNLVFMSAEPSLFQSGFEAQ